MKIDLFLDQHKTQLMTTVNIKIWRWAIYSSWHVHVLRSYLDIKRSFYIIVSYFNSCNQEFTTDNRKNYRCVQNVACVSGLSIFFLRVFSNLYLHLVTYDQTSTLFSLTFVSCIILYCINLILFFVLSY